MQEGLPTVIIFIIAVAVFLFVEYIGNKITAKGEDAIRNAHRRRKNFKNPEKRESLADRYRK